MKNLARGSVFLASLFALVVVSLFYAERQVGAVEVKAATGNATSFSADLSNSQINSFEEEQQTQQDKNQDTRKRVVNTTTAETAETSAITEETNNTTETKTVNSALLENARGFSATAYCLKGRTANGGSVRRGIVAADPRVLPLGTRIFLNAGGYSGSYIVADTGGGVKGRKLDIWVPTCSEAVKFGRRSVSVSVVAKR